MVTLVLISCIALFGASIDPVIKRMIEFENLELRYLSAKLGVKRDPQSGDAISALNMARKRYDDKLHHTIAWMNKREADLESMKAQVMAQEKLREGHLKRYQSRFNLLRQSLDLAAINFTPLTPGQFRGAVEINEDIWRDAIRPAIDISFDHQGCQEHFFKRVTAIGKEIQLSVRIDPEDIKRSAVQALDKAWGQVVEELSQPDEVTTKMCHDALRLNRVRRERVQRLIDALESEE
jgi:hypothetical protein